MIPTITAYDRQLMIPFLLLLLLLFYSYSKYILKEEKKNIKPQTVPRNSMKEHVSAVEESESVNASCTPSLTISSSLTTITTSVIKLYLSLSLRQQ